MTDRSRHKSQRVSNWFSGRLVPGQDPANAEFADEQMNFGFSTGALKPKRSFLVERGVNPDDIFRQTRRDGRRRREAEE